MNSGNALLETWIPDGGFRIERRKVGRPDGSSALAECLVPKWAIDDLTSDHPCARQPCPHRVLADCPPAPEEILRLADCYSFLTVTIPRKPSPGEIRRADVLPPEAHDIWRAETRTLRTCTAPVGCEHRREPAGKRHFQPEAGGKTGGCPVSTGLLARR
jgi:hypothetical protein